MPDKPKTEFESGCYYHVYNHGNSSDDLFIEEENYLFFMRRLHFYLDEATTIYAWCLIPNNFHLLIKVKERFINKDNQIVIPGHKIISEQFRHFFTSYSKAINKRFGRRGTLFLRSYHRKKITDDNYLKNIIRYIHMNPVHHGFAASPGSWRHSSFNAIVGYSQNTIGEELIRYFGGIDEFLEFHHHDFSGELSTTAADLKDFKNL